jgi:flagellin
MRINHNISAMNTYRQYNTNATFISKSMEKLSSGYRINRAADDAAGLSISEKMRSQIRGLKQATRNAQDGISFLQTAEGALTEVSDMLTRLKELAVQVQNGTYSDEDKANIGAEMAALGKAISDIYLNTKFNGIEVFGKQTGEINTSLTAEQVKANFKTAASDAKYIRFNGTRWESTSSDFQAIEGEGEDADYKPPEDWLEMPVEGVTDQNGFTQGVIYIYDKTAGEFYEADETGEKKSDADPVTFNPVTGTITEVNELVGKAGLENAAIISYGEDSKQSVTIHQAKTQYIAALVRLTAGVTNANTTADKAAAAKLVTVDDVEAAITEVNTVRAGYGALQNQLEHASNNMSTTRENLQAAESRVRDVDMAEEMMEYTKNNILLQAAQAMLAQANAQPQGILQLLQ